MAVVVFTFSVRTFRFSIIGGIFDVLLVGFFGLTEFFHLYEAGSYLLELSHILRLCQGSQRDGSGNPLVDGKYPKRRSWDYEIPTDDGKSPKETDPERTHPVTVWSQRDGPGLSNMSGCHRDSYPFVWHVSEGDYRLVMDRD
ncbi:hypothetical protein Cni_G15949 [Canna indica]|uniref:Uncharacterized protein n=1 Tax=Canna indica TaxID=4628 RepID=A0AAQ3KKB0_9LILI|nr:hypothetical protein Cni_G15949 [Canna indica]